MLDRRAVLWVSAIVFPPLGLVLAWLQKGFRVWARLGLTVLICIIAVAELFLVYGMRVDWNGNFSQFMVSFESHARHDARVEESRAAQKSSPVVEPTPVAVPEPSTCDDGARLSRARTSIRGYVATVEGLPIDSRSPMDYSATPLPPPAVLTDAQATTSPELLRSRYRCSGLPDRQE